MMVIDASTLSSIVGIALALLFAYVPGVEDWFNALTGKQKAGAMGLALVAVSVFIFAVGCAGALPISITCTQQGVIELLQILIAALIANQATYVLAVKPFRA